MISVITNKTQKRKTRKVNVKMNHQNDHKLRPWRWSCIMDPISEIYTVSFKLKPNNLSMECVNSTAADLRYCSYGLRHLKCPWSWHLTLTTTLGHEFYFRNGFWSSELCGKVVFLYLRYILVQKLHFLCFRYVNYMPIGYYLNKKFHKFAIVATKLNFLQ